MGAPGATRDEIFSSSCYRFVKHHLRPKASSKHEIARPVVVTGAAGSLRGRRVSCKD